MNKPINHRLKHVSISSDPPVVHVVDNTNRRGIWEQHALDRTRFRRRVQTFETLFKSTVLVHTDKHRKQYQSSNHEHNQQHLST